MFAVVDKWYFLGATVIVLWLTLAVVVPLALVLRVVVSWFSKRTRNQIKAHPFLHWLWLIGPLFVVLLPLSMHRVEQWLPKTYWHERNANEYWRMVLDGRGTDIARWAGKIFYLCDVPSWVRYVGEDEARLPQDVMIRMFIDSWSLRRYDPNALKRVQVLTSEKFPNMELFQVWWIEHGANLAFAADDIENFKHYAWTNSSQYQWRNDLVLRERKRIARGYFKTEP